MTISVIIPTYRRPKELLRCLDALKRQTRKPEDIIVVVRKSDSESLDLLKKIDTNGIVLRVVVVDVPGHIAALNVGLDRACETIVAFTDDDGVPRPDWLQRLEKYFQSDVRIGGVGGRDCVYHNGQLDSGKSTIVGRIQWFGRMVGGHRWGIGGPKEVDLLKGVNMSFRLIAINGIHFDERLRGTGVQMHNERDFCLRVKRAGWKLIYDPRIAVDHYLGERYDEDKRNQFNLLAIENRAHNETLVLLEHLPFLQKIASILWVVFIGNVTLTPGLAMWLFLILPNREKHKWSRLWATLRGRWQGYKTWRFSKYQNVVSRK